MIHNLIQLRGLGIFEDCDHAVAAPPFRKYNLVYGFNGTGKTTLSRVFRSLEIGKRADQLPQQCSFSVDFGGQQVGIDDLPSSAWKDRILVFNQDFVDETVEWREGSLQPVFYIGREQAGYVRILEALQKGEERRAVAMKEAGRAADRADTVLRNFKRQRASLIAEDLNLGRRYDARTLDRDYESFDQSIHIPLSDEDRSSRRVTINLSSPGEVVSVPNLVSGIVGIQEQAGRLPSGSVGQQLASSLASHPAMLGWVRAGFHYHSENALTECLFCTKGLEGKRLAELAGMFDDAFEAFQADGEAILAALNAEAQSYANFLASLPPKEAFADQFRPAAARALETIRAVVADLASASTGLKDYVERRLEAPNASASLPQSQAEILDLSARADDALADLEGRANEHNLYVQNFIAVQAKAAGELRAHHLLQGQDEYRQLTGELAAFTGRLDRTTKLHQSQGGRVARVRNRLRSHGPALAVINPLLSAYLGHAELQLQSAEEGYTILRRGRPLEGPLSEGEKTALSFCYFISRLNENQKRKAELIVVVDDPISSLDAKALNYAFNLMKNNFEGVAQLFVLTHNVNFMNETKKWLKNKARGENGPATATLYFLETTLSAGDNDGECRLTKLVEMPKLLRDYDSEYHYLLSQIIRCADAGDADISLSYGLPNAIRKALELFLAFKAPGPDGVDSKLNHRTVRDCGVDQAALAALGRMTNLESHGDSLDDLITFSPMTIEETRRSAGALLALMEQMDGPHLARMRQLCA